MRSTATFSRPVSAPPTSKAPGVDSLTDSQRALLALGRLLRRASYRFTTPTPATQARVLMRGGKARTLADIFGWNRPFDGSALSSACRELLAGADALAETAEGLRSTIRFSTLDDLLLVHSGFPTEGADAVFFGPDTYRFAREIRALFARHPLLQPRRVIDIGAGTGAAGLLCERLRRPREVLLLDINERALGFCAVNAALNEGRARPLASDVLGAVVGEADLIVSNPPYLVDSGRRTYRHGGGHWGSDLSLRILKESLSRLAPGGKLLLYTGSAIVGGVDTFRELAEPVAQQASRSIRYEEIDPDVFGEELERAPYDEADRIAAVCLTIE